MMKKRATVETIDDIVSSIESFGDVDVTYGEGGSVKIEAWPYTVNVQQHEILYHWTLQAKDDPSDADEGFAADPLAEIVDSMSEGVPGAKFWEQYASSPDKLAVFLRRLASSPSPEGLAMLKKMATFLMVSGSGLSPLLDLHRREIRPMAEKMKKKGWRAMEVKDDNGLPAIEFEIGDAYDGKIMLAKVLYNYEFNVDESPEISESGTSDSVMGRLKSWLYRNDVAEAADLVPTQRA